MRIGSSLSASSSFQRPVKSTPEGGVNANFSVAHAVRNTSATSHATRMNNLCERRAVGPRCARTLACARWHGGKLILNAAAVESGLGAVFSRNPDAALERLETHAHGIGSARDLRAAADFAVRQIRAQQINEGGAGFVRIRGRQRMGKDAGLDVV